MQTKRMMGGAVLLVLTLAGTATVAMAGRGDKGGMSGLGHEGRFAQFDFAAIDTDKDGKVTLAELEAHRLARLAMIDTDKDGKLSAAELKARAMERAGARAEGMATRMIERHDSDGDGLISADEMAAGPSPKTIFERIDSDKDGAISMEEAEAARKVFARHSGRHHGHGGPEGGPQD